MNINLTLPKDAFPLKRYTIDQLFTPTWKKQNGAPHGVYKVVSQENVSDRRIVKTSFGDTVAVLFLSLDCLYPLDRSAWEDYIFELTNEKVSITIA